SVVGVDLRTVPGLAIGGQSHPGCTSLAGADRVQPNPVAGVERVRTGFAEAFGAALEQIGVLAHEKIRAVGGAGFLVGSEREHDVTTGSPALAHPGADHGEHHRVHALHVDRAAAPQDAVTDLAGEGVNLPVGRLGGNDVEVPVDEDGVAVGFGAVDARDDVRPAGRRFDHGGLDADVV